MLELKIDSMVFGKCLCRANWIVNEKGAVYHRLYYVYCGEAFYSGQDGEFPLEKSHIYLFPVNKPYRITHNPDKPFQCLYFHVTTFPLILNPVIGINTLHAPAILHMVKILEHIIANIEAYPNYGSILPQLLNSMVNLFEPEITLQFSDGNRLQKVLDYIHEHSLEKLTNSQLADLAGYDRYYFARLFRKNFGVSPQEYIANYRFTKAEFLLRSNMSVKQVSGLVGFQDDKAFSRAFRKARGCTPSDYMKSHFMQP